VMSTTIGNPQSLIGDGLARAFGDRLGSAGGPVSKGLATLLGGAGRQIGSGRASFTLPKFDQVPGLVLNEAGQLGVEARARISEWEQGFVMAVGQEVTNATGDAANIVSGRSDRVATAVGGARAASNAGSALSSVGYTVRAAARYNQHRIEGAILDFVGGNVQRGTAEIVVNKVVIPFEVKAETIFSAARSGYPGLERLAMDLTMTSGIDQNASRSSVARSQQVYLPRYLPGGRVPDTDPVNAVLGATLAEPPVTQNVAVDPREAKRRSKQF